MKYQEMEIKILKIEFRNVSLYGNPSYYIYGLDDNNEFFKGYTAPNSASGYSITNYKKGQEVKITYHITNKGNMLIHRIEDLII